MASAVTQSGRTTPARRPDERAEADSRATANDKRARTANGERATTANGERAGIANDERAVGSARPGIAARGASAANAVTLLLSRAVRLVTWLVVVIIVAGIALRLLDANTSNAIVHDIHGAAKTLIGPFSNVFKLHSQKTELAVNWGLAALVYLILGSLIAGLIAKAAPSKPR